MKQVFLAAASAAAVLVVAGAANAAEPKWDGFYWGVDAGYATGPSKFALSGVSGQQSVNLQGFEVGARVGHNWQVQHDWLVGVEGDASYVGATGKSSLAGVDFKTHVGFDGDLRAHFGRVFGSNAVYVIGGGSGAQGRASIMGLSERKSLWGWDAGLGFEHKVEDGRSGVRVEWVHTGFGKADSSNIAGGSDEVTLDRFTVGIIKEF